MTTTEAIPGTHEPGYVEPPLIEFHNSSRRLAHLRSGALGVRFYTLGACTIIKAREPAGANGERLWHLSISHPDRHPTWDEIKTARYRLLPTDRCFGMLLPPPDQYVNIEAQDHVFHLWEITDPREPWEAM